MNNTVVKPSSTMTQECAEPKRHRQKPHACRTSPHLDRKCQFARKSSPRAVGPVQGSNLPRYTRPFQFAAYPLTPPLLTHLLPLHQLIRESQMWLNNDVEPACSYKAVRSWKGEAQSRHRFCDTDGCRAGDANAAVDECCCRCCLPLRY